ncbi:anhydro-N-acetylmuramic acid kinase [Undibacterium arcticum]|uniref:Anhydro-N-acetylmuramic acid kinase n=1 Tax=Undibacterium arcticum TaxID=1762892 RepID=A0ABV7F243_9BURK
MTSATESPLYIGLMSGTSLDGVDGVLTEIAADFSDGALHSLGAAYVPFPESLRSALMALQAPGDNEIEREAACANQLARHYADCVAQLLAQSGTAPQRVRAIGVHGQTIRHRPELGCTRQTNNPALLAELTGIDVIADFRSRDIAAGGQGAPLVPAFHQAVFGQAGTTRVVANIGGISNISVLDGTTADGRVLGFDTGPGNLLMDAWIAQHQRLAYDADGAWAAGGKVIPALLHALRAVPYFELPPPKSTGRDLFHPTWLAALLLRCSALTSNAAPAPADVQATLAAFTATTLADAIATHARQAGAVYVCGGGAYNGHLMRQLELALQQRKLTTQVHSTAILGVAPNQVEALAFAWLAHRFSQRQPGNLPGVTGARGLRILGALYPGT